jgi:hypothetical protein
MSTNTVVPHYAAAAAALAALFDFVAAVPAAVS